MTPAPETPSVPAQSPEAPEPPAPSEPSEPMQPGERQMRRAWAAAQALREQRLLQEHAAERAALQEARADAERRADRQEARLARLRRLLDNRLRHEPIRPATDLARAGALLARLEGPVAGARKTLQIPVQGLRGFVILGRLQNSDGQAAEPREALISFRFLDAEGHLLEQPGWLRQSEIYGSYRYISPDPGGWFERAVSLPEASATLELTVHDFRAALYKNDPARTAGTLRLSDILALPDDLIDWRLLAGAEPGEQHEIARPGALLLTDTGVQTALTLPAPVKAVQFEIALGLEALTASRLEVVLRARGHAGEIRQSQTLEIDGGQEALSLGVHGDSPFSQLVLELRSADPGTSLLLLDRSIRRVGCYPDPGLFRHLNAEQVAPELLDTLADDWERRGKWFCVHADLQAYEAPLVLVRRLTPDEAPMMLNLSHEADMEVAQDRRGMVCSLIYYDASGRRIAFQDPEFALSPAVANYKYVPVENRRGNFLHRLARPEPGGATPPAYMAVCLQGWNRKRYRHISASPLLAPVPDFSAQLTALMLQPESDSFHDWHGVFARQGSGWRRLLPASWRAVCAQEVAEVMIRLGGDESRSPWRDIGDLLWSPEAKPLRAILGEARRRGWPLRLHLERLAPEAALPRQLLGLAERLVVTAAQAPQLAGLTRPGARIEIVPDPGPELEPEAEAGPDTGPEPGAAPDPQAAAAARNGAAGPDTACETEADTGADTATDTGPDSGAVPEADTETAPDTEPDTAADTEAGTPRAGPQPQTHHSRGTTDDV